MHTITTQKRRGQELVVGFPPVTLAVTGEGGLLVPSAISNQQRTGRPEGPLFDVPDFTVLVTGAGQPLFFTRKECIDFGFLPMSQEETN